MNIILRNRYFLIVFFSIIYLKVDAQFLDKTYYLVDSIKSFDIDKSDKAVLDKQIKLYRSAKSDTAKIKLLSDLVENLQDEKIWIRYNRLLISTAKNKLKTLTDTADRIYFVYKSQEAMSLNNVGYYYFNYSNRYDLALKFYNDGLKINEDLKNYDGMITSYSNVGNTYQNMGDFNKALIYCQKALALENRTSDKLNVLPPLNNIAQIYFLLNDTAKALETLKRAFSISAKSNNNFIKGSLLHNIGIVLASKGDKTGIPTLKKSMALRIEIGDKKGTLQTMLTLANLENINKNFVSCKHYLEDAEKLVPYFPNSKIEAYYYYNLGKYYSATGKPDLAITNLEKSLSIYTQNPDNLDQSTALGELIQVYSLNNKKYAFKKLEAYELQQKILKTIDKSRAQKLLLKQKYEEDLKINEAGFRFKQELKDEKNKAEKHKQQLILIIVCLVLLVTVAFSFFIFRALKINKQKNKIISDQKNEVEKQKQLIEEKHKDIKDSITYAHRIQSSLIPTQQQLANQYAKIKVVFKPKDIVSGDFYWYNKINNLNIFVLADCTGHGVPGAFMSIIGINCLNTLIIEKQITIPHIILNKLKTGVVKSLNSDHTSTDKKDGMDVALIAFNSKELVFSGANQSLLIQRNKELITLKGNKQPIGFSDRNESFTSVTFELFPADRIILFSDGVVDQFGGIDGKKLKIREFKNWLVETSDLNLHEQSLEIELRLNKFMYSYEQTDDITLAIIEV